MTEYSDASRGHTILTGSKFSYIINWNMQKDWSTRTPYPPHLQSFPGQDFI